jgi:molecular chaperone GrpE
MSPLPMNRWFSSTGSSSSSNNNNNNNDNDSSSSNSNSSSSTETPPPTDPNETEPTDTIDDNLNNDEPVTNEGNEPEMATAEEVEEDATIIAARKQSQQLREMKEALLRSLAEQENTRTIAKRDVEQARQYAIKSFAKSLLDVADNLQRALDAVPKEYRPYHTYVDDDNNDNDTDTISTTTQPPLLSISPDIFKTLYEGIEMTERGLKKALENHGVVQYGTVGDVFDPNQHEALMEYTDNTKPNNTIGIVMKCGYTLHQRVLRPAEVGIIKSTLVLSSSPTNNNNNHDNTTSSTVVE